MKITITTVGSRCNLQPSIGKWEKNTFEKKEVIFNSDFISYSRYNHKKPDNCEKKNYKNHSL
jgi:hypothetical protein